MTTFIDMKFFKKMTTFSDRTECIQTDQFIEINKMK